MSVEIGGISRAFGPRTVAVVGDKRENDFMWLRNMEHFQGSVYSVQIDPEEVRQIVALGFKNYSSLMDIPGPVDYVVVAVPRGVTPRIIHDCIEKKVGGVALFTSGFAETGTEEGIRLQNTLQTMARDGGLNLIGPNCMGIFNPAVGLRHGADQYYGESGEVGFISQSGTQASLFATVAATYGLKVSKSVSYGNAIVLDAPDYLEYFLQDAQTRAIGMYIEGTRNGERLMETLKRTTSKKPVVIWKGGQTEAGSRATASHTASLTRSPAVWQTMIRQAGAIGVNNLDSLIDVLNLALKARPLAGKRLGLVAISGGQAVAMTDAFTVQGMEVPRLSDDSYASLAAFFKIIGGTYKNPVDISWSIPSIEMLIRLLSVLDSDRNIDIVALELPAFFLMGMHNRETAFAEKLMDALADFNSRAVKPFISILTPGPREREALDFRAQLIKRGLLSYPSFERAAKAVHTMVEHDTAGPAGERFSTVTQTKPSLKGSQ